MSRAEPEVLAPPAARAAPGFLSGLLAAFRQELRLLLYARLTPIFQLAFLLVLAVCVFLVSDWFNQDEASLGPFLVYLPLAALVFVPALAMRAWPSDLDDRSVELTLTLPWKSASLVLGRYLAGALLLLVTLAFTLALPATAAWLGDPDLGRMAAGYLGAALFLLAAYAVALFAAALAREPVAAFLLGVILLGGLQLLDWNLLGRVLEGLLPAELLAALPLLSPAHALRSFDRGLVEAGALAGLLLLTAGALAASVLLVACFHRRTSSRRRTAAGVAIAALGIAVLLLVPAAQRLPWSWDMTEAGDYSLAPGTREILTRLPEGTEARLYWSESEASVPSAIKSQARRLRGLLQAMARASGGRLSVTEVDPAPDSREELAALRAGIQKVPMSSGDSFFLGATFEAGERLGRIPYLDVARAPFLEYDLAVALEGLTRQRTPKLGILSPLLPPEAAQGTPEGLSVVGALRRSYDVAVIPFFSEELPEGLDVLLLVAPAVLQREALVAIDQFLLAGGSLVVLLDPFQRTDPASNVFEPRPSVAIDDISDLLSAYGITYQGAEVIGDRGMAARVQDKSGSELLYPYWLRARPESFPTTHPALASLQELLLAEPGAFVLDESGEALPLVVTGAESGSAPREAFEELTPRALAQAFEPSGGPRVVAAVRQGRFESAFGGTARLAVSERPGLVFAVADVDWIFDAFALQAVQRPDGSVAQRPLNDNLALLQNLIGYAAGDRSLLSIRSRGTGPRNFTRVEELFREADASLREQEAALSQQVAAMEARLQGEAREAGAGETGLPEAAVEELLQARAELREVRRGLREEVDRLGLQVKLVNLAAGPLLVLLFAAAVFAWRRRRWPDL